MCRSDAYNMSIYLWFVFMYFLWIVVVSILLTATATTTATAANKITNKWTKTKSNFQDFKVDQNKCCLLMMIWRHNLLTHFYVLFFFVYFPFEEIKRKPLAIKWSPTTCFWLHIRRRFHFNFQFKLNIFFLDNTIF